MSEFETDSVDGAAHVCDYCGRPFAREDLLALHHGQVHWESLSDAERESFEEAYDEEQATIRRFRLLALGTLVLLYFGFLMVYAVV